MRETTFKVGEESKGVYEGNIKEYKAAQTVGMERHKLGLLYLWPTLEGTKHLRYKWMDILLMPHSILKHPLQR